MSAELSVDSMSLPASVVSRAPLPVAYEKAKRSLAKCERLDECKTWADKAAAVASYARQAKDEELMNYARRIRVRAVDRMGELIKGIESQQGRRADKLDGHGPTKSKKQQVISDAGLSTEQALSAIRVNNVPRDEFESAVESDKPPTVTALAKRGKRKRKKKRKVAAKSRVDARDDQTRESAVFSGNALIARDMARQGCKAKRITQAHINICQTVIDAWTKLKLKLDKRRRA